MKPCDSSKFYSGTCQLGTRGCHVHVRGAVDPITPGGDEMLTVLAEECAEVSQVRCKIDRFGLSTNPWTGVHNREALENEIGDIFAAVEALRRLGVVDGDRISARMRWKLAQYLVRDGRLGAAGYELHEWVDKGG